MNVYRVPSRAASEGADAGEVPGGGLTVAFRLADVTSPLRNGAPAGAGDRSALVIGGTVRIRSGEVTVFCKVVAVAPARVRRDGRVQAQGSPAEHATLGPAEEWLDRQAGPGVIGQVAERAVLRKQFVKGERKRLLTRAFMIRVVVLMTLMPDADVREAVIALAGDLAMVPWARAWVPASARACGDWRNALGPEPLEELQAIVLGASWAEHEDRDWRAVIIGRARPLRTGSLDGTLIRVPDTPANRAAFGSVGTGDDSSPFPQVRALPLNDVPTRALLGMPHGPAGTDKAAAGQKLLDTAMTDYPHLFAMDRVWLMDRNFPGAARIARLIARTHVLIRLKSDIPLRRTSPVLADGSYLAELSGDGVTVAVRVIEYYADVGGQEVPEMFCLVTDLTDIAEYPARDLAALYKWRWDGSETALREAKAPLRGAGPGTGPMLRSGTPGLVRQELAAWAAGTEMTRGVARDAALTAIPARKGRRAGQPVRPRDISCARTRRAVITAIRAGTTCYETLTRQIAKYRTVVDRNRHRARKSKSPSSFGHATAKDTLTRIAPAIITMANQPA
ncbi:MAG TPA: transposase domain-containing protein [Streptosporangiaceae bacterium]|nr:transposase domain-containing protein [Streptosporangiaceae bacterium]